MAATLLQPVPDTGTDRPDDAPAAPDGVVWLPSEAVLLLAVSLPAVPAHQRQMALTYAVEEAIAAPLDSVEVVPGPALPMVGGAKGQRLLAAVVAKDRLAMARPPAGTVLVADVLAVPQPGQGWAVWASGTGTGTGRVLVRRADGTGFACSGPEFQALWQVGGEPALTLYGAALVAFPTLTPQPLPPPDPRLMRFDLGSGGAGLRLPKALWASAAVLVLAAGLHLAVMAADVLALRRTEQMRAADLRAALMARGQPGTDLDGELAVVLAAAEPQTQAGLLPLLAQVSDALVQQGSAVQFRALHWAGANARLTISATAPDLPALQQAQAALTGAGLALETGAATSGDGTAEAELTVMAGAP